MHPQKSKHSVGNYPKKNFYTKENLIKRGGKNIVLLLLTMVISIYLTATIVVLLNTLLSVSPMPTVKSFVGILIIVGLLIVLLIKLFQSVWNYTVSSFRRLGHYQSIRRETLRIRRLIQADEVSQSNINENVLYSEADDLQEQKKR